MPSSAKKAPTLVAIRPCTTQIASMPATRIRPVRAPARSVRRSRSREMPIAAATPTANPRMITAPDSAACCEVNSVLASTSQNGRCRSPLTNRATSSASPLTKINISPGVIREMIRWPAAYRTTAGTPWSSSQVSTRLTSVRARS